MKFHQWFFKILRKQNVTETLTFVSSSVQTDVKTVYPPTNTVCGGGGGGGGGAGGGGWGGGIITKWHNSYNTDPLAPIFLQNMQCLMIKM